MQGKACLKNATAESVIWQVKVTFKKDEEKVNAAIDQKACFVLTTNIQQNDLSDLDILKRYKGQSHVESGFIFLKDP